MHQVKGFELNKWAESEQVCGIPLSLSSPRILSAPKKVLPFLRHHFVCRDPKYSTSETEQASYFNSTPLVSYYKYLAMDTEALWSLNTGWDFWSCPSVYCPPFFFLHRTCLVVDLHFQWLLGPFALKASRQKRVLHSWYFAHIRTSPASSIWASTWESASV